jgi:hypothetical protein
VTPVVKVMFSSKAGVYLKPEVIDLSRAVGAERIVSIENPEKWGISGLERFWAE